MASTKLLLIRHGETDDNHNRIFQGQGGEGINARGREQAKRLAARMSGAPFGVTGGPVEKSAAARLDVLYCSHLVRARETADILGEAFALTPIEEPGLCEVDLGAWQGLDDDEVALRFPDEWEAWRCGRDIKRGGGESYAE